MPKKRQKPAIKKIFTGTGLKKGFTNKDLVEAVKRQIASEQSNTRRRRTDSARTFGRSLKIKGGISINPFRWDLQQEIG